MKLEQMESRAVVKSHEPAVLFGYELAFNKQAKRNPKEGYANIVTQLDRSEGVPFHYTKEFVDVIRTKSGERTTAITYIANPEKVVEGLLPTKDYVQKLLENQYLSDEYEELLNLQPLLMSDSEEMLDTIAWFLNEFEPGKAWHEKHFQKAKNILKKHNYKQTST
jgi:hypothetical protein